MTERLIDTSILDDLPKEVRTLADVQKYRDVMSLVMSWCYPVTNEVTSQHMAFTLGVQAATIGKLLDVLEERLP